jgi:superfamily II DNA or RNA helicase
MNGSPSVDTNTTSNTMLVDLCSSDEDASPKKKQATATDSSQTLNSAAAIKRKSSCLEEKSNTEEDEDDDDCIIVEAPTQPIVATTTKTDHNDDAELEIVGTTGPNALEDYPHARQDCVLYPLRNNFAINFCNNCYCYVCDVKASACLAWNAHCFAKKGDFIWERRRKEARRLRRQEVGKVATLTVPPATPLVIPTALNTLRVSINMWEQDIQDTQATIVNEEIAQPTEIGADDPSQASIKSLLQKVTNNYSQEAEPPRSKFTTTLRSYQKQSLAFMKNLEERGMRGGWLSSDVGMGKSAIVLALSASDNNSSKDFHRKTTVVLTSVSLMGQWEDEVKKHAPGLVVRRFHRSSRSRVALDLYSTHNANMIHETDIIISTATFRWPSHITDNFIFHRVVMDEAHLLSNATTANLSWAKKIRATHKWCVTANPCTSSILDLQSQMQFLEFAETNELKVSFQKLASNNINTPFQEFARIFAKYVIRHEKAQLQAELKLPTKVFKIVTLKMSTEEKLKYSRNLAGISKACLSRYQEKGVGALALNNMLIQPLSSNKLFTKWNTCTKISALLQEMKTLQQQDLNLRAVVYTQYTNTHYAVVEALKRFFIIPVVYSITGTSSSTDRDFAIRAFQGPRTFPAVIVIMLRAGSVGMTLTQASHLYLMEPCLDQVAEIQAMGRIHRIGQTRDVELKKFVFQDSVEANIVVLHKEIEARRVSMSKNMVPATAVKILTRGISF